MWIYLKNNWALFILKMPDSRGSPCINNVRLKYLPLDYFSVPLIRDKTLDAEKIF